MGKKLLHILLLCLLISPVLSQTSSLSNLRTKKLKVEWPQQIIDTAFLIPASVEISNAFDQSLLDTALYHILPKSIRWEVPQNQLPDSILIRYRVLPYPLDLELSHLDSTKLEAKQEDSTIIGFEFNPYDQEALLIDFKGLNYNGSFSRGISFGNNQDLVLNSRFNLQLAGDLGDDIEILAAITDENIPLQPEGNTQQLREFDRIFIQLSKDKNRLIAGDYELRRPNSYFLNYFKKLQGATFSNEIKAFKSGTLSSNASIAISRGKFSRNVIQQQEGNQGPYKLTGSEGERFIIVLSGTEKVWIDGQLMRRGLEEDYVIDYNRGEIRFTSRRLITKDSRIIVEFEYSDQNYLRSIYAINTGFEQKKFRGYINFYSEQDSKNSTGDLELSDEQKRILSAAGDDFLTAVVPGIDTLEAFSSFRAMYQLVDTLLDCGIRDTILVYSTNPDSAFYVARFSFVGNGNGNYMLDASQVANERVYKWVPPDPVNCQPRGNFEPVVQLVAPEQRRMLTLGGEYLLGKKSSVKAEIALSQNDQNRFSRLDKADDAGLAAFTAFNKTFQLSKDSSGWQLETDLSYEFVEKNFQPLNPYRSAEFTRDWNLSAATSGINTESFQEQIARGGFNLVKSRLGRLEYNLSSFTRGSVYEGLMHQGRFQLQRSGWEIDAVGNWLSIRGENESSNFSRPKASVSKTFRKLNDWKVGVYGEREKNDRFQIGSDTLSANSFYYDLFRIFLESPVNDTFNLGAQYTRRFDYAPVGREFQENTIATEMNVNGNWRLKRTLRLGGNLTYRALDILDAELSNQEPSETFLGRADVNIILAKGAIQSGTTYEIGSGQEPKLEFDYVPVEPGQGNYIWLDSLFNNDGVIQDFEMEIAPFQDIADHIRVSTFTDEFIRTDNVSLNQSLRLEPRAIWYGQKKGLKKFLGKFSTQSTLKISRKTRAAPDVSAWNPFQLDIADTSLVAVTSNIRNLLFFNRSNPKYDFQVGMTDNRNKIVQTSGFESRRTAEQFLKLRWNISKTLSTNISVGQGQRETDSEFFNAKDYFIEFQKLEPQFTYLPSKQFRAILKYRYQQDENTLKTEGETALQHDFSLELTYNRTATTSIRSRVSYINIDFSGEPNSPVGFAMLNGLQNGRNFLWNLSLDRRLSRNIQLSLSYEGRKTGMARVVHVGRAQVAATF